MQSEKQRMPEHLQAFYEDYFETDHGLVRIKDMDREGLLQVIAYLKDQNAQLQSLADSRFELLKSHWDVGSKARRSGKV